jgi:hypothetical protein
VTFQDWIAGLIDEGKKAKSPAVPFQEWIAGLIGPGKKFKNPSALAAELGMKVGPFKRAVAAGTFSLDNLALLAEKTEMRGPQALRVFKLAQKQDFADRIEHLLGVSQDALTALQREIVNDLEVVPQDTRDAIRTLLRREAVRQRGTAPTAQSPTPAVPRSRKTARHG